MESLLTLGYFSTGILTESNTLVAGLLYEKSPRKIILATSRIDHCGPKVAEVMREILINVGVPERDIIIQAKAKNTIAEVRIYRQLLNPNEKINILANEAQIPRLVQIIRTEFENPAGRIYSTQQVLAEAKLLYSLNMLESSTQQRWYSSQEAKFMRIYSKNPKVIYRLLDLSGKIPFVGDLNYLSYLAYQIFN